MGRGSAVRIGVLTASISRRAGGLFLSVRSLARELVQGGCSVRIFSVADQFSDEDSAQWNNLDLCILTPRGPGFCGYAPALSSALEGANLDLLHTHGLWMYPSVAGWRWSKRGHRPLVVSPRGMLDPWAVQNSAWKKRLAGVVFEKAHLRRAACIHALCRSEYESIRKYGLGNPVAVIPNGVSLPDPQRVPSNPEWAASLPASSTVLLFLGRIHPKKGLVHLLYAWAEARRRAPATADSWFLVVAGWDQGGHLTDLNRLAEELGIHQSVRFVGPQFGEQKSASLTRADSFILPSFSEGLPMAVLEAWSHRLPVLMTPQCNLPEGFRAEASIRMEPERVSIATALITLFKLSEGDRLEMGQRGRRLVEERFTWPIVAEQMRDVYAWALGQAPRPACLVTD